MVPAYKETTEPRGPICQGVVIPLQVLPLRSRVTPRAALVEEELLTIPENPNSSSVFSGVRVAQILFILYCLWTIAFLSFFLSTQFLVGFVLLKF